jgi:phytoene dehydrogenase-like protein
VTQPFPTTSTPDADAIVVGSGPNGLVAANLLADAGWSVLVLEAEPEPGGAVRSGELTVPGFVHDRFSAFYPLAFASPVIRALRLDEFGLQWSRAPLVLAHPTPDGKTAVLSMDLDETAASLDGYAAGDGDAWRKFDHQWQQAHGGIVEALLSPFPPVRATLRLTRAVGPAGLAGLTRIALSSAEGLTKRFSGEGGPLLLAGNLLHTDLTTRSIAGGIFGWMLSSLGREYGFPVPTGGSGNFTAALVRRLEARGGRIECDTRVTRIDVRAGRAVGVTTAGGDTVRAGRAVLTDVSAPALYGTLLPHEHLPARTKFGMRRFKWDHATVKVDWALSGPIPWESEPARRAGTLHIGESMEALATFGAQLKAGVIPDRPFLLVGQMTTTDPSRSPAGTETAWAYTHVPQGRWDDARDADVVVGRMEAEIEQRAPGFRDLVIGRHVLTPPGLQAVDANLVGGAVNGGTAALRQQFVLRPVPGGGTARTPVKGLYLASASAHPGGGVHGACGANAVHATLKDARE